jgi:simple sugar transport system permease protein
MTYYEKRLSMLFAAVVFLGGVMYPSQFLSWTTIKIFSHQIPEYGLITLALMLVMISSGLDLSVVATTTLAGILGALTMEKLAFMGGISIFFGIFVMIGIGMLAGGINGFIVSYVEVPPILTTLGTMLFFQGIALIVSQGGSISSFPESYLFLGNGSFFGIPIPMILFILIAISVYYVLSYKEVGKQIYRIGRSKIAASYSGIPVKNRLFEVYLLSGIILGIAAVIMTARYNSIRVDYGSSYLINGIVAISLGGVDIKGGKGTVIGVFLSLCILSGLMRILNLSNVPAYISDSIMGGILLVNLIMQHFLSKQKNNGVITTRNV